MYKTNKTALYELADMWFIAASLRICFCSWKLYLRKWVLAIAKCHRGMNKCRWVTAIYDCFLVSLWIHEIFSTPATSHCSRQTHWYLMVIAVYETRFLLNTAACPLASLPLCAHSRSSYRRVGHVLIISVATSIFRKYNKHGFSQLLCSLKFGVKVDHYTSQPTDDKPSLKGSWSCDLFKFWEVSDFHIYDASRGPSASVELLVSICCYWIDELRRD